MNQVFSKLLNLFLISNEKENLIQGSIALKEQILIVILALRARFFLYIHWNHICIKKEFVDLFVIIIFFTYFFVSRIDLVQNEIFHF